MTQHGFETGERVLFTGIDTCVFTVIDELPDEVFVWGRTDDGEEDGFPYNFCHKINDKEESPVIDYNTAALDLAAEYGRSVEFGYKKDGSFVVERRTLSPVEACFSGSNDQQIVVGYDPDRREPRAFRVDRIADDVVVR